MRTKATRALLCVAILTIGVLCVAPSALAANYNVKNSGATGNGTTDDRPAIVSAITYYKSHGYTGLYFPAGTYRLGTTLSVPAGTTLVGESMTTAWLKGRLLWTSNSTFTDLRIGNTGTSTANISGVTSSYTTFTRCRFRGGGGSWSSSQRNSVVLMIGDAGASAHHITFSYCDIERNLGVETPGDRKFTHQFNNVSCFENGAYATAAHLSYITFDHCHNGVANGAVIGTGKIGCPRFAWECYCSPAADNLAYHGWDHLYFTNCVVEIPDACALDLPSARLKTDPKTHACQYAWVTGCTFKGAGKAGGVAAGMGWGYNVALEGARNVTITGNTFGRSADTGVSTGGAGNPTWVPSRDTVVTNNVFNYHLANGITVGSSPKLRLLGNSLCEGNVFYVNSGAGSAIHIGHDVTGREAKGVHVHGNYVHEYRTSGIPAAVRLQNTSSCVVTGNTLHNHNSTANPTIQLLSTNTSYTITPNTLLHK